MGFGGIGCRTGMIINNNNNNNNINNNNNNTNTNNNSNNNNGMFTHEIYLQVSWCFWMLEKVLFDCSCICFSCNPLRAKPFPLTCVRTIQRFSCLLTPLFSSIVLQVIMIEPDHGFLKPQENALLKVSISLVQLF